MIKKAFAAAAGAFMIFLSLVAHAAPSPDSHGAYCSTLFTDDTALFRAAAARLKKAGVGEQAYVVDWEKKNEKATGPYRRRGSILVVPIKTTEIRKWQKEIGDDSIGLMLSKLPEANPHTARIRVANRIYGYGQLQHDDLNPQYNLIPAWDLEDQLKQQRQFTELTIPATPREQKALIDFLEARRKGIKAKFDVKNGPKKGEVIRPVFDEFDCSLTNESCAAAAMSPFAEIWLEHYDQDEAKILRKLRDRLQLEVTQVARRMIWSHIHNPQTSVITLLGVDQAENKDLATNFIEVNSWGRLLGLPLYGRIPDHPSGHTKTFRSKRTPLNEWLEQ